MLMKIQSTKLDQFELTVHLFEMIKIPCTSVFFLVPLALLCPTFDIHPHIMMLIVQRKLCCRWVRGEQEGKKNEIKLPANQLGITPKLYIPSTMNTQ